MNDLKTTGGCGVRAAGLAAMLLLSGAASAQVTLLSDDFEAYAPGSNLVGQNGWVSQYGPGLRVGRPGTNLPTQVLDGHLFPGSSAQAAIARLFALPIDPSKITALQIDVHTVDAFSSDNSFFGFDVGGGPDNFVLDGALWAADRITGWRLNVEGLIGLPYGSAPQLVAGGFGTAVKLGIVVDGVANEVYGIYDFGVGWQQTAHFAITPAQIASITGVGIEVDHRFGRTSIEYDNLLVQSVPEPSTYALWLAGIAGLGLMRARRRG